MRKVVASEFLSLDGVMEAIGEGFAASDAMLRDLAGHENVPLAGFLARLLEYPTGHLDLAGDGWPLARLLRPLAVGLLGLAVVVALDRFALTPAAKCLRRPPKGTGA